MSKVAVVVPTNRPEMMSEFIKAWHLYLAECGYDLFIVEDTNEGHAKIEADVGKDSWIFPRGGGGVRSYGFLQAWREGYDYVLTLDDDVRPAYLSLSKHIENLTKEFDRDAWFYTVSNVHPRGVPYRNTYRTKIPVISHGLWAGVPDQDGIGQLSKGDTPNFGCPKLQLVPVGRYYPMCSMNLAFSRGILPAMYFPLMGPEHPYSRFDDIWAGIISKKICDHLGLGVCSGYPIVHHERASDPFDNLIKEAPGIKMNETFWEIVDDMVLTEDNVMCCYYEIASNFNDEARKADDPYLNDLGNAMRVWLKLLS